MSMLCIHQHVYKLARTEVIYGKSYPWCRGKMLTECSISIHIVRFVPSYSNSLKFM